MVGGFDEFNLNSVSRKVGYTSGVFDLFHYGHAAYLRSCKELCDVLIVGVDCDLRVRRNKGGSRPIHGEATRLERVMSDPSVDYCFVKVEDSLFYLNSIRPAYCFYSGESALNRARNEKISRLDGFVGFYSIPYTKAISTSKLISVMEDRA
ncbi:adenylyltransferase/cytidyltransferase family protein [Pseudomonas sp. 9.1(2019)]|uniref:adenylyltransferase/cytidyltransferase family protein n=1 Tax=Pseudomonas sp. 9.1(2019) TaxID=2580568 RepID=UPI001372009F|nr:hypothetical protein [Pseudomonas sp. 9.1(2019)]